MVPQGSGTILLVEDDPSVRAIARRTLEDLGYAVQEASNGAEAIALTARYPAHIDLLVTDVIMPRVGGGKLARRIRASRPDLPVLFMSGFSDEATRLADLSLPGATLISKPFTREALGRAVEKALKGD
jgi:CheY-like chemotaxis protein